MEAVVTGSLRASLKRHAKIVSIPHAGAYDNWFVQAVEKGLKEIAEGRVLSADESKQRDAARRAALRESLRDETAKRTRTFKTPAAAMSYIRRKAGK